MGKAADNPFQVFSVYWESAFSWHWMQPIIILETVNNCLLPDGRVTFLVGDGEPALLIPDYLPTVTMVKFCLGLRSNIHFKLGYSNVSTNVQSPSKTFTYSLMDSW